MELLRKELDTVVVLIGGRLCVCVCVCVCVYVSFNFTSWRNESSLWYGSLGTRLEYKYSSRLSLSSIL